MYADNDLRAIKPEPRASRISKLVPPEPESDPESESPMRDSDNQDWFFDFKDEEDKLDVRVDTKCKCANDE